MATFDLNKKIKELQDLVLAYERGIEGVEDDYKNETNKFKKSMHKSKLENYRRREKQAIADLKKYETIKKKGLNYYE